MVRAARILELDFTVTGFLMTLTFPHIFPVLATARTAEGFTVPGQVFNIREMVFVQVQVKRAGVVAVRAAKQGGGNLGSIFFIVFVFTVALSRRETVYLNIHFIQFLQLV